MLRRILGPVRTTRFASQLSQCYCQEVAPEEMPGERRQPAEKCVNQVNLMGRVGRDPEIRGSEERPIIVFSLATNSSYPKDNEYIVRTDWHRISVFNSNIVKAVGMNIRKGDRMFVSGKIRYDEYMDQRTNTKTRSTSIVAFELVNLTKKYLQEDTGKYDEED